MDFLDFIRKVHQEKKERGFVIKGGKGSGWFAPPGGTHVGKKPTPTESSSIFKAITKMVPSANRDVLEIPASGLADARVKAGDLPIMALAYNPKTGILLAGGGANMLHAHMIHNFGGGDYDDFVKMNYNSWVKEVSIETIRLKSRDSADAFGKAWEAAQVLKRVGFPGNTKVVLKIKDLNWIEKELSEMGK